MIVYTSGSTGEPKGCMLPNRSMAYRAQVQWQNHRVSDYPRVYCPLPLNHVGGMQMVAGATLFAGGTVNFRQKFDPAEVGNVLREGSNGYTCFPTPPMLSGTAPMCMDAEWMEWADAWSNKKEFEADTLGISYMLAGDEGASNIDPYAEGPTDDNEWIKEGAHLMIIAPPELLEGFPTDPDNGGPYVMWAGTPYAHLMVPIGSRD